MPCIPGGDGQVTHHDLVKRAERWLRGTRRCLVVACEIASTAREVPDAIGWRSHQSILIECKATRADFLSDAKKPHRIYPEWGMGELRYYMTPPALIALDELPPKWGLLEAGPKVVRMKMDAAGFPAGAAIRYERRLLVKVIQRLEEGK